MKRFNKVVSAAVASAMVLAMAACGGNATDGSQAASSAANSNAAASSEATGNTGADQTTGTSAGTFVIGGIGPLTGGAAIYGNAAMNGAQIAVDEINAAGGINGAQIKFLKEDDQHDPEKSVNAYNSLKDQGMQILMGTVTSTPCVAVADKAFADGMFVLTPSASSTDVIVNDNVFQVCFTDPNQGAKSAEYISDKKLATKIGIIYDSSDVYSSGIKDTFVKQAPEKGLAIVAEEAFTADSKTDFSTQLQKCQSAGAELVFMPFYYTEASIVLTQANNMGYAPIFFGVDGMDGILSAENFDTKLAEGLYMLTPFAADAKDAATVKFVDAYQKNYGETPIQFAADAYDAIYIIKAAIEQANVTPDQSIKEIGDALTSTITTIKYDGITGSDMTWAASGEVSKAPMAIIIKDGAYASVE